MHSISCQISAHLQCPCLQVPGNIRRAEHFVHFLTRFLEFMRRRMDVQAVEQESPRNFLDRLAAEVAIDGNPLEATSTHCTMFGWAGHI